MKEIQERVEKVQRIKRTQHESAKLKTNEVAAKDIVEIGNGILVICDDAQEQWKIGQGEDKEANQQKDQVEEVPVPHLQKKVREEDRRKLEPRI